MNRVIDKYANSITLHVTVPPPPVHAHSKRRHESFEDNFVDANRNDSQVNSSSPVEGGGGGDGGGGGGDDGGGGDGGDARGGEDDGDGGDGVSTGNGAVLGAEKTAGESAAQPPPNCNPVAAGAGAEDTANTEAAWTENEKVAAGGAVSSQEGASSNKRQLQRSE